MAAFNTLRARVICAATGAHVVEVGLQYRYGATQQYRLEIGDTIAWGVNDVGVEDASRVLVAGYPDEDCPTCGAELDVNYTILVVDAVVVGVGGLWDPSWPLTDGETFAVIE